MTHVVEFSPTACNFGLFTSTRGILGGPQVVTYGIGRDVIVRQSRETEGMVAFFVTAVKPTCIDESSSVLGIEIRNILPNIGRSGKQWKRTEAAHV